ncbi:hypothetical protein [Sphingomonas sp. URHD0057]|uniref:hypothetical protein n=1 Tax=Sphingomonas sp. URHD0057 TaxID=1380389 RepID=UPI000684832F|nr:hypothetical protein [Sphingomonas sp. URHD0057]
MRRLFTALIFWLAAVPVAAAPSRFEPIIAKVAMALETRPLVGIGDGTHRQKQAHQLQMALLSDPRISCKIDAVAVEFGNSALQSIADRYVLGTRVPLAEKRRIWRDTGQWLVWDSPLYENLFDTVRDLNRRKLCPHPLRVLLADPPIDWGNVHTAADYRPYRVRDEFAAQLIEREVLAKGQRALLIFGDTHLWKALPAGSTEKPRMAMIIEQHHPGSLASFVFLPDVDHPAKGLLPAAPSLALLRGRQRPLRDLMPHDDTVAMKEGDRAVERPLDEVDWPPADQLVDGFLNLGPLTDVDPDPAIYRDPAYQTELRRRAIILKAVHGFDFSAQLDDLLKQSHGRVKR